MLTLPIAPPVTGHPALVSSTWAILCAGFALAPDLDHPSSTAARMWGPISQTLATALAAISGGHRWATHDLILAPAAAALLVTVAARSTLGTWILFALATGLVLQGLGFAGLGRVGPMLNLLASIAACWWMSVNAPLHLSAFVVAAAAVGIIAHILGDALTPGKVPVPLVWPWTRARIGFVLFTTDRALERRMVAPALVVLLLWAMWARADIAGWGAARDLLTALAG